MYAVLELADSIQHADRPLRALNVAKPTLEQPFNAVRAIGRPLVSESRTSPGSTTTFWPAYFGMLARQRFNRFHLALGFGYDTLRTVVDAYLLFAYPFLLSVPGYKVRAVNLPDEERDHNLEMLQFISREAAAHGLDFQLGLWTHGYTWDDSPNANYTIEGLTPGNQAPYSRDALAALLQACPDITGVTLRTHYESGVHEGSYAFWKTIFEGVPRSGRKLEIELHAKGLDQKMIDAALSTGMPVRLSAKYWAEHLGLPYHQAAIRELELPHTDVSPDSFSGLSTGSRNHTRYGYADFLQEGRPYGVMYRVFPGTHKFLLWGDPVSAAAYARAFQFCGSDGAELLEPLSFKGRRGSGLAGSRSAYADPSLGPRRDWEKYLYTYLVWGRLLYNPDAHPDTWRRLLRTEYGSDAPAVEAALGSATRILPIITTAHLPSAAQDTYSPEFYTNQSIPDAKARSPYGDTPARECPGIVSRSTPALFSTIDEYVGHLTGERRGSTRPLRWRSGSKTWPTRGHEARRGRAPLSRQKKSGIPPRGDRYPHAGRHRPLLCREASQWGALPHPRKVRRSRRAGRGAEALPPGKGLLVRVCRGSESSLRGRHHLRPPAASARPLGRSAVRDGCRLRGHGEAAEGHPAGRSSDGTGADRDRAGARAPAATRAGLSPRRAGRLRPCETFRSDPCRAGAGVAIVRSTPLPARKPGRALPGGRNASGERSLAHGDSRKLHGLPVSAAVLLRAEAGT
jgi:hypothetical protein